MVSSLRQAHASHCPREYGKLIAHMDVGRSGYEPLHMPDLLYFCWGSYRLANTCWVFVRSSCCTAFLDSYTPEFILLCHDVLRIRSKGIPAFHVSAHPPNWHKACQAQA